MVGRWGDGELQMLDFELALGFVELGIYGLLICWA